MKRVFTFCLIFVAILLTGCKEKTITNNYTIGCIDFYNYGGSDWAGFEAYMNSVVEYNKLVQYTNHTVDENDAAAAGFFNEQVAKIDKEQACSYISETDHIRYGIARKSESGEVTVVRAVTISANGIE